MTSPSADGGRRRSRCRAAGRSCADANAAGYCFLLPWLIGFFGLTLGPALISLYLSFTDFDLLRGAALDRRRQLRAHRSPPTRNSCSRCA